MKCSSGLKYVTRSKVEMQKVPVLIIVGPKDILENQVSVRTQNGEEKVKLESLEEFLQNLK